MADEALNSQKGQNPTNVSVGLEAWDVHLERNAAGAGYVRLSLTPKPNDVAPQTSVTCSESATAQI